MQVICVLLNALYSHWGGGVCKATRIHIQIANIKHASKLDKGGFWLTVTHARTDARTHAHTHTHTHPFNGPLSGTTRVSWYQKGKTNLDFTEARDSEWQWHQLGYMQVCTSLQTDNHASTRPLSFLQAGCPSCCPINNVKALKAVKSKKKVPAHSTQSKLKKSPNNANTNSDWEKKKLNSVKTTTILQTLHSSTCVSQPLQIKTTVFRWSKMSLPMCPCWRQTAHMEWDNA